MKKLTARPGEKIKFKIRFNTAHGETNLFWRVIIDDNEYLVTSLHCNVPTFSDSSYDERAGALKYHIAGYCTEVVIDAINRAIFS